MGFPQDWNKTGLGDIESINNLDAARMTLRWALERLRSLEERNAALEKKSKESSQLKEKVEEDQSALKRALVLREEEWKWRDDYYQRMRQRVQELVASRLSGSPDAASTATREMELARLEEEIHRRRIEMEKEYESKMNAVRAEYGRLKESLELEARNQSEHWAKSETERQIRFNKFMSQQRALLESQNRELEAEVQRVASWRVQQATDAWEKERAALIKEIQEWKEKAGESRRLLHQEERSLDAAKEESLAISRAADIKLRHLEEERRAFNKEQESIRAEAKLWREKSDEALNQLTELKKKNVELENALKQEITNLAAESTRRKAAEERSALYEKSWAKRQSDFDMVESTLLQRFKDIEDEIERRDRAWKQREDFMRKRDQNWHNRLEEWQGGMREKSDDVEKLRAELLETVRDYIKIRKGEKT